MECLKYEDLRKLRVGLSYVGCIRITKIRISQLNKLTYSSELKHVFFYQKNADEFRNDSAYLQTFSSSPSLILVISALLFL